MHDLPFQSLLQQSHARPISGEELEAFGKKAADLYTRGDGDLTQAVVETVKHAGLSPEQVRRVVEFANTTAYLTEFKKEGSPHRVIEFQGGPADPAAVLQDLNDGGGGSTYDRGMLDYASPPAETKVASAAAEEAFASALSRPEAAMVQHNPFGEVIELKDKLASLYEHETSVLSGLEGMYMDLAEQLYGHVKQAAMSGTTLGEVVQAWAPFVADPLYVKTAFEMIGPRLVQEEVFRTLIDVDDSISKTASEHRMVNEQHPLVVTMTEFCETLDKLAAVRETREQTKLALDETVSFLRKATPERVSAFYDKLAEIAGVKEAAPKMPRPGLLRSVVDTFEEGGKLVGKGGRAVGDLLFGPGSSAAETMGRIAGGAVTHIPHAIGGLAAVRGAQHLSALGASPVGQTLKSFIPGTPEYQQKSQELAYQYSGYPFPMGY